MPRYFFIRVEDLGDGESPVDVYFSHCEVEAPNEAMAYESGRAKLSEEEDDGGLILGEYCIEVKE